MHYLKFIIHILLWIIYSEIADNPLIIARDEASNPVFLTYFHRKPLFYIFIFIFAAYYRNWVKAKTNDQFVKNKNSYERVFNERNSPKSKPPIFHSLTNEKKLLFISNIKN